MKMYNRIVAASILAMSVIPLAAPASAAASSSVSVNLKGYSYDSNWGYIGAAKGDISLTEQGNSPEITAELVVKGITYSFNGMGEIVYSGTQSPHYFGTGSIMTPGGTEPVVWNMSEDRNTFTMSIGNFAIALGNVNSYEQGFKLNQSIHAKKTTTSNSSLSPNTYIGPGGGYYYDTDPNVRGQQFAAQVNSYQDPDTYFQFVGPQDIVRGSGAGTLFYLRTWLADNYLGQDYNVVRVNFSAQTNQSEVFAQELYPNQSGQPSSSWSFGIAYGFGNVSYSYAGSDTGYTNNGTSWSLFESGYWGCPSEVYQSDSTANGIASRVQLVASDQQATGNFTGTASADMEWQDPAYNYFWINNDNMPFAYSVVS